MCSAEALQQPLQDAADPLQRGGIAHRLAVGKMPHHQFGRRRGRVAQPRRVRGREHARRARIQQGNALERDVSGVIAIGSQRRLEPGDVADAKQPVVEVEIVGKLVIGAQEFAQPLHGVAAEHHRRPGQRVVDQQQPAERQRIARGGMVRRRNFPLAGDPDLGRNQ